jgi:hypothetical protein
VRFVLDDLDRDGHEPGIRHDALAAGAKRARQHEVVAVPEEHVRLRHPLEADVECGPNGQPARRAHDLDARRCAERGAARRERLRDEIVAALSEGRGEG